MDIKALKLELLERIARLDDEARLLALKRLLDSPRAYGMPGEHLSVVREGVPAYLKIEDRNYTADEVRGLVEEMLRRGWKRIPPTISPRRSGRPWSGIMTWPKKAKAAFSRWKRSWRSCARTGGHEFGAPSLGGRAERCDQGPALSGKPNREAWPAVSKKTGVIAGAARSRMPTGIPSYLNSGLFKYWLP